MPHRQTFALLRLLLEPKLKKIVTLNILVPNEEVLEEERKKIREEYENEMLEMREKYASEQKSKAKMAAEVKLWKHFLILNIFPLFCSG